MIHNLHFIRPNWLWLLLVLIIPLWLWIKGKKGFSPWRRICHNHLLKHLLGETSSVSSLPLILFTTGWILSVIAGAGPSFNKNPTPTYKITTPIVLLLDTSLDMTATDIAPNRFERAKFKIIDFLKKLKDERVALVLFSDYAYTIVPFTDDKTVLNNMLQASSVSIMPSFGHNMANALIEAEKLLNSTDEAGQVIIFTSNVGSNISKTLEKAKDINQKKHKISIIGIGTEKGEVLYNLDKSLAKNSSGKPIISKLDPRGLDIIATAGGGIYTEMTFNDNDLNRIYSPKDITPKFSLSYKKTEIKADEWQDLGANLLIIVLIIASLGFKRGWLGCLLLVSCLYSKPANAFSFSDLFLNHNQKAQKLLEAEKAQEAAELFTDPDWKAASLYRSGDYEEAEKIWQSKKDDTSLYNSGNAKALAGDFKKAIEYYEGALKQNPDNQDAKFNKKLLEKMLEQKQQQQSENQDQQQSKSQKDQPKKDQKNQQDKQDQTQDNKNQEQQNQNNQQNSESKQEEQKSDKDQSQQQEQQPKQSEKKQEEKQQKESSLKSEKNNKKISEKEQAINQMLERAEDDPQDLLRNILYLRYQRLKREQQ